ncbi:MAG: flagellar biosynthesis protein FlgG [Gracilibacter sp. BRH_c7a]|nr:MAG: flagellar biosynthesis protein FlgG [Gracilibacter sp. BRH_c7a]
MKVSSEYLQTLQNRIEIIGNNIANVNTPGFKEGLLFIEETYDAQERSNTKAFFGGVVPGNEEFPTLESNLYVGQRIDFRQGPLVETNMPLDMAIFGEGFFQVKTPDEQIAYTRVGSFTTDEQGNLVTNSGMLIEPHTVIPTNVSDISVKTDGTIKGIIDEEVVDLGKISLFRFENPHGLEQIGNNLFLPTAATGEAIMGEADSEEFGTIKGGMLERSNTDIVNAMTKLIEAQRAYQFDLRVAKDQDEMMVQAIQMRG